MSISTHFFVASLEEAEDYESNVSAGAEISLERAVHEGLTAPEMAFLWAILAGEKWNAQRHKLIPIESEGFGQSWLHEFPIEFINILDATQEDAVAQVAKKWVQTEELATWSADELEPVISDLIRLADKALAEHKDLYLWGSL